MDNRVGFRALGVDLPAGELIALRDGDSHVPQPVGIQILNAAAPLDEATPFLGKNREGSLDAVKNIADDTRPQRDRHGGTGGNDRVAGFEARRHLVDLDDGMLAADANDLAHQAILADIDHLLHGEVLSIGHRDDRPVDTVYHIVLHEVPPWIALSSSNTKVQANRLPE